MRLSDFDYQLPRYKIAQVACEPRDSARLLVDRGVGRMDHRHVSDLGDYLRKGDVLVVNDTKVIPGRLQLRRRSGGGVEVLLLDPLDEQSQRWTALVRPGGRLKDGEVLRHLTSGHEIIFCGRNLHEDTFIVDLCHSDSALELLGRIGSLPLPPYIDSSHAITERYQTVYARRPASAAAPTAGLHLTNQLIESLKMRGVKLLRVELVVGLDTFQPIQVDNPLEHKMHTEFYAVSEQVMEEVQRSARVVAVGTTSVRTLESAMARNELSGRTDLFIHRGFDWKLVDVMMTNFHLPRTTLLLMIDAFIGDRWREIYDTALSADYRFLSLGDAMLLDRHATMDIACIP